MRRRPTLKDVATLAGVSTATVARVIHKNGYVADSTRLKVETVLDQTGYQINALAQGLRGQRTHTIGHLLAGMIPHQFFATVAAGVEEEAAAHGCGVVTINTDGRVERERRGVETLIQRRVDAVLFTGPVHGDNVRIAIDAGMPVVQIERTRGVPSAHVTSDNIGGTYAAVKHLIDLGHRRIAIIAVDPRSMPQEQGFAADQTIEQDRLDGYAKALCGAGIEVDDALIALWPGYFGGGPDETVNPGYISTHALREMNAPPTAIFTTMDLVAAGVLQALYERGCRVPQDVSVVGFDDTYAQVLSPPLTTVANPMREMGRAAARLVFDHLERNSGFSVEPVELPMNLIVRKSTGPPPPGLISESRAAVP